MCVEGVFLVTAYFINLSERFCKSPKFEKPNVYTNIHAVFMEQGEYCSFNTFYTTLSLK